MLGLIVLILSISFATAEISDFSFEPVDDCTINCWDGEGCDKEKCESLGCILCDPLTCAPECNNNQEEGKTCNTDEQCAEGLHCSGGARAVIYQKACCPENTEWNYLNGECFDDSKDFQRSVELIGQDEEGHDILEISFKQSCYFGECVLLAL